MRVDPVNPDGCPLNVFTGMPMGPSLLSSSIFVLSVLSTLGSITNTMNRMNKAHTVGNFIRAGIAVVLQIGGLYLYFSFYRRCSPWLGWFIFVAATTMATGITQAMDKEESAENTTASPP
jgi:uncharacterized membrane-anchored protein